MLCYVCKVLENANQSIAIKHSSGCLGMGGRAQLAAEGRDKVKEEALWDTGYVHQLD